MNSKDVSSTLLACVVIALHSTRASAAQVSAVSVADPASPPSVSASGDSFALAITPDGAFVLFISMANNLVTNPCHGTSCQLFLRCRTNGTARLVSVNAAGGGGDGDSSLGAVTPDGRYVVFQSDASDLVTNDANDASDVFVRDMMTGTTRLVSVNRLGNSSGNGASFDPVTTPDGRCVAFASAASDLVNADANNFPDVFVRDLWAGITTLASVGARKGNGAWPEFSGTPVITPDGQFVAFSSTGSNLVASAQKTYQEVYVRDLASASTIWASTNLSPASTPASYAPALSDDGRYVTFKTAVETALRIFRRDLQNGSLDVISTNAAGVSSFVPDPHGPTMTPDGGLVAFSEAATGSRSTVRVWDALSRSATIVSVNLSGQPSASGFSDTPAITPDGRFVTFLSSSTDLVTNSVNGDYQVYVRDRQAGTTTLVSADALGSGVGDVGSSLPELTADGRFVLFESRSAGYVPNDGNSAYDVFVRDTEANATELITPLVGETVTHTANGASTLSGNAVSADGRYVVFKSLATDLVAGAANGSQHVYLRDRQAGTTTLVSVNQIGTGGGNGHSSEASLSADGSHVVFLSNAEDLVLNDTNKLTDVFVRNLLTGTTMLASVATNGWSANKEADSPSLSADGQRVAFGSRATNLAADDSDSGYDDVFVRDLAAGTTLLASTALPGDSAWATHAQPLLSPDGRLVSYWNYDNAISVRVKNLETGALTAITLNGVADTAFSGDSASLAIMGRFGSSNALMVVDLTQGTNTTVGIGSGLLPSRPCLWVNSDGRYVAFTSLSPLVGSDANNKEDVFVFDRTTRSQTLISRQPESLVVGNDRSYQPRISADGRFVVFRSFASDLVPFDGNDTSDVFRCDRLTGQVTALSCRLNDMATASGMSLGFAMAADARCVAFISAADDLIAGDANETSDVFAAQATLETPRIEIAVKAGQPVLSWPTTPNLPGRVQYKDSLAEPAWHTLPGSISVSGPTASIPDAAAGESNQRFYRLLWE